MFKKKQNIIKHKSFRFIKGFEFSGILMSSNSVLQKEYTVYENIKNA